MDPFLGLCVFQRYVIIRRLPETLNCVFGADDDYPFDPDGPILSIAHAYKVSYAFRIFCNSLKQSVMYIRYDSVILHWLGLSRYVANTVSVWSPWKMNPRRSSINAVVFILFCLQSITAATNTINGRAGSCTTPFWQTTLFKLFMYWAKVRYLVGGRRGKWICADFQSMQYFLFCFVHKAL